jgi:hypothetical protein
MIYYLSMANRVEDFIKHMKEEIANIPKDLSEEECLDRAERCRSLSDTFARNDEKYKAKKYEILSQKYKQLAYEKKHPKPALVQPKQEIEIVEEVQTEEKPGFWQRFFMRFKSKSE